jgi:broad specificity phosphatase PhoE
MKDNNYCTLYIVRHGETEWNINHTTMGQKDSPLTKAGIEQAHTTAKELKDIHFDAIFSSDSLRAHRTAEIIKLERDLVIQTTKLLRERTYGHFEGKPHDEYMEATKQLREQLKQLSEEEKWKFKFREDVESDFELVSRFITKLREIAVAYPNKTVLVATHGGCIRMFLVRTGVYKKEELPAGSFGNAGYLKVLSDGVDFFVKEVKGVKEKPKGSE